MPDALYEKRGKLAESAKLTLSFEGNVALCSGSIFESSAVRSIAATATLYRYDDNEPYIIQMWDYIAWDNKLDFSENLEVMFNKKYMLILKANLSGNEGKIVYNAVSWGYCG